MHKIIASLLLAVGAAAILSSATAVSPTSGGDVAMLVRVSRDGRVIAEDDELGREGSYHELRVDLLEIRYRLSSLTSTAAQIEVVVICENRVVATPSLAVGLEETVTVGFEVDSGKHDGQVRPYELEFRLDDRQPPAPRPLLPAGGEPAPVPVPR